MKRWTPFALVTTAVLLMLGGSRVRAEMVDFSYAWSTTPGAVLTGGTGNVSLALTPDGSSSVEVGSPTPTFIPAATVTTSSSATQPADVFNAPFGLTLHLTDTASGQAGDLTFNGTVSGELTGTTSTLNNTFSEPVTQTLTFGDLVYTVTIDPVTTSLPAPGEAAGVLFDAMVTAQRNGEPPPPPPPGGGAVGAPEPSSLVLGGSALLLLGLARRRLRRRAA
jgi:hypothetical protein